MSLISFLQSLFGSGPAPAERPPPADAPRVPPPGVSDEDKARLPAAARGKVDRVLETIALLEGRLKGDALLTGLPIELARMREAHLPSLVASYIEIPAEHRREIFRRTGKSAIVLLDEALDQMLTRLETISLHLAQDDLTAFSSNTQFISSRYGEFLDPFN